jgi:hypothetical protein
MIGGAAGKIDPQKVYSCDLSGYDTGFSAFSRQKKIATGAWFSRTDEEE